MKIIEDIYTIESLKNSLYLKKIEQEIKELKHLLPYEETVKPQLRDIKNVSIIPISIFKENEEWVIQVQTSWKKYSSREKLEFQMQIKELTVDIPMWAFESAKGKGEIYTLIQLNYLSYPVVNYQYSFERGLVYTIDEDAMFF